MMVLLWLALIGLAVAAAEVTWEEGVMVLTEDNFQEVIKNNKIVLVEFYAPWCGHCKDLAPEYEKAAKDLAEQQAPIKLAKVDATIHSSLAEMFQVEGYPTLKFFRSGKPEEYDGGRTGDTILAWLRWKTGPEAERPLSDLGKFGPEGEKYGPESEKTGPVAANLDTVDAAKALIKANEIVVVGFFKDVESAEAKAFLGAAGGVDEVKFGIASDAALFTEFTVEGDAGVVLFKKFDDGRNNMEGDITEEAVGVFVSENSLPLVVKFNQDTSQKIFSGDIKSHLLLLSGVSSPDHDAQIAVSKTIAAENKGEMLFVTINTDEEDHKEIMEFFGLGEDELPAMRIIRLNDLEDMAKYKPAVTAITEDSMRSFVQSYKAGELKQDLMSEEVAADWNALPVKVLVGNNFKEVAMDAEKHVLVEFYSPSCGHCKQLAPIWDQLGETYEGNANIVIAKIDSTANELENVKVQGFPTIKLFKKGDNSIIGYNGQRTLEGFKRFLDSDGIDGAAANEDEEEGGDDEDFNEDGEDEDAHKEEDVKGHEEL